MSQISRPFQIALVAFLLIFALWFVVLRGHSSGSESSPSAASSSSQPASSPQSSAGSSSSASSGSSAPGSSTYHGSAPGVAGLTRAIAKARGAVAQSQQEAKSRPGSGHAAGSTSASSSSAAATHAAKSATKSTSHASHSTVAKAHAKAPAAKAPSATSAPSGAASAAATGAPAQEVAVQSELKAGRTVIILFWSPSGSDDRAVHGELRALQVLDKKFGRKANKELAVHYAHGSQVGQFGAITRSLQILQTPTTIVISPSGNAKTLTGLVDAYTIQQAISEARHP
jgi:hypothetical protein